MIQLQVLNYVLETKDASFILDNNLDDSFFSDVKDEFNFIKTHIQNYGNVPDKTVFLDNFQDFHLFTVTETPDYLIQTLYADKNERFMIDRIHDMVDSLNAGDRDKALELFKMGAEEISNNTPVMSVDLLTDTSRYSDYIDKLNSISNYYVTTGFPELDEIIGGWDRKEELVTIAARTNMGKSWILLKCAVEAAKQGLRVGIYSGEMSDRKVGYRVDTLIAGLPNSALVHGNESVQLEYQSYIESLSHYSDEHSEWKTGGALKVLTPTMIGGPAGVSTLRAFIEKEHLDMLCIDQHSLLEDDRKAKNPVEKASNISKDIKNLQVLEKIPIIAVSQQNRASTENGVDASHIAQSDRIAQDSTVIIFVEQEQIEGTNSNRMKLKLVKSRDSTNKKELSYTIDLNHGKFLYDEEDSDDDDSPSFTNNNTTTSYGSTPF